MTTNNRDTVNARIRHHGIISTVLLTLGLLSGALGLALVLWSETVPVGFSLVVVGLALIAVGIVQFVSYSRALKERAAQK
ncbi:MAG: hypothetical protein Q4G40_06810 [Brachybacterium sp.]|nr:hypothetical protein [Brachybacterium sp.]